MLELILTIIIEPFRIFNLKEVFQVIQMSNIVSTSKSMHLFSLSFVLLVLLRIGFPYIIATLRLPLGITYGTLYIILFSTFVYPIELMIDWIKCKIKKEEMDEGFIESMKYQFTVIIDNYIASTVREEVSFFLIDILPTKYWEKIKERKQAKIEAKQKQETPDKTPVVPVRAQEANVKVQQQAPVKTQAVSAKAQVPPVRTQQTIVRTQQAVRVKQQAPIITENMNQSERLENLKFERKARGKK